jgi:hypothetical protein
MQAAGLREAISVEAPASPVNARKPRQEMFKPRLLVMGLLSQVISSNFLAPRQTTC